MPKTKTAEPTITGIVADKSPQNSDDVIRRLQGEYDRTAAYYKRAVQQTIEFKRGPVCLCFAADLHLGSCGVDYARVFEEAEIVRDTPGMWLVLAGDLLDNFVASKLMHIRNNARSGVDEEWTLVYKYLETVASKLLISVSGNHERFTFVLSGIDYFKTVLKKCAPRAIYDSDDVLVTLRVNKTDFPMRVRHHWIGSSIYNPTHQIERAAKFDNNFIVGVGAHTHTSALVRQFNNAGATALSVLCGSYKAFDLFARQKGFPKPNGSTIASVIFYEDGAMLGTDRLSVAREIMLKYHK